MTKPRKLCMCALIALCAAALPSNTIAEEPTPIVATFSILSDMVSNIGGDLVTVTTLVGRNGDTHVYQPTPADAKSVKQARLMFTNGLEFEGWLDRLAEAAEFDGVTVVATNGVELISMDEHHDEHDEEQHDTQEDAQGNERNEKEDDHHDEPQDQEAEHDDGHNGKSSDEHHHGEFDPHGWLSLRNAIVYVDNIAASLAKLNPTSANTFYQNRADYVAKLEALDKEITEMMSSLPISARTIVTSHDAFQYFGRDYGLTFIAPQGLSTDSEASAQDVAKMIKQIRAEGISAVFVENVADPRLLEQIASETGSSIGGQLYPGALSETDGPASTYLDLMRHNASTIAKALAAAN